MKLPDIAPTKAPEVSATPQHRQNRHRPEKPNARATFARVIVAVEKETGAPVIELLAPNQGTPEVSAARVLAMAAAVAVCIPPLLVARMFGRCWKTVDSARAETLARCLSEDEERDKFIRIIRQAMGG